MRVLALWCTAVAAATLALAIWGCSLPGAPRGDDGDDGRVAPPTPVYPEHHQSSAWSSFGMLAYCDRGVVCVRSSGRYTVDDALRGVYLFDPATGRKKRIAPWDWGVDWHPSEPRIAYGTPTSIVIADTSGAVLRVFGVSAVPFGLAWSPDGRWLAWAQKYPHPGIWIVNPDSGLVRRFTPLQGWPTWGASSDALLTVVSESPLGDRSHIVALSVATGAADTLRTVALTSWFMDASPDGRSVVIAGFAAGEPRPIELHRVDLASGAMTRLTRGGAAYPAFRRSDGAIAYVRGHPWSLASTDNVLWILDAAGAASLLVPPWPSRCE